MSTKELDLISTTRVARELGKSESTIRHMANDGRLPTALVLESGARLFSREAIEEHKSKQTAGK